MPRISLRYDRPEFEEKVGIFLASLQILPKNKNLYTLAFIHRSVLNEAHTWYNDSNERIEFLGDAVLELVITEKLFSDFPEKSEGEMTDIRSALVRGRNLALIAREIGCSDVIQLSRGESMANGQENPYILANTLEAIIGAIYLDHGFLEAKKFILQHVYITLDHILDEGLFVDPKSHLQEVTQAIWWITPTYTVSAEEGQDHNKIYVVIATLGNTTLGEGKWSSKKKSEQDAAENAIAQRKIWESKISLPKKSIPLHL